MLEIPILFIVSFLTLLIGGLGLLYTRTWTQRAFLLFFLVGLFIWSGVGAAYKTVGIDYLSFYIFFLIVFVTTFDVFSALFYKISYITGKKVDLFLSNFEEQKLWLWVIVIYLILELHPMVFPRFRLHLLFMPQSPSLTDFASRFSWYGQTSETFSEIINYLELLIKPFFFIALYKYRHNIIKVSTIIIYLLYVRFINGFYLSRSSMLIYGGFLFLVFWRVYPSRRKILVFFLILFIPMMLFGFQQYTAIRANQQIDKTGYLQSIFSLLENETSFPRDVGMPIIESNNRVNLGSYFTWIITLPVPKILTGPIKGARINYEITKLVTNRGPEHPYWSVVLPGLVSESIYIFGKYFYWLHALMIGVLGAFVVKLVDRPPQFLFLKIYLMVMLTYKINRAGISAVLPSIINGLLSLYIFIFFLLFFIRKKRKRRAQIGA